MQREMSELAIFNGQPTINIPGPHCVWPRITDAVRQAVMTQLEESISIYNRSGIFERFEDAFVQYHGDTQSQALLQNSGTSALWSMFVGADLQPGDEIICPSYSFYATYSPLMMTGAVPVFCDSDEDGNIDPVQIESLITKNTKAVIVTHMWGIPCDMPTIREICNRHGLLLFEDCSHAHGAEIGEKKVGTWGDAAAWSLQGQKIITGGEGGILLTRNEEIFTRALLLGQYNKRPKQQMSHDHPLYKFALTGFGLKLRAHPLAIAMAMEQFSHLDVWITQKQTYATKLEESLSVFPFLRMPKYQGQPAWYAFVFQFDEAKAQGVTIKRFEEALHAEGLVEVDRPGSTCPNYGLPLFTRPDEVLPHLYPEPLSQQGPFPKAEKFYQQAIKLPVWAFPDEAHWVEKYIAGITKVAQVVQDKPELLR